MLFRSQCRAGAIARAAFALPLASPLALPIAPAVARAQTSAPAPVEHPTPGTHAMPPAPGVPRRTVAVLARDTATTSWIARVAPNAQAVASVCTGAWVLAGAGVLGRGDTAATHWLAGEELARLGVAYTPARVHHAGRVWTSAGVSAGLDLGLSLTAALGGRALAEHAQLAAQYDPRPPFDAGSPEKAPVEAASMRARHAQLMREIARRASADSASGPGVAARGGAR